MSSTHILPAISESRQTRPSSSSQVLQDDLTVPFIDPCSDDETDNGASAHPNHCSIAQRDSSSRNSVSQAYTMIRSPNNIKTSETSSVPDLEKHLPPTPPRIREIIGKSWIWEILACFLSLACLASIVGVLLYEDSQELGQWKLGLMTPTAVVAFIGTLTKVTIALVLSQVLSQLKWFHFQDPKPLKYLRTFDNASRGPIGAVQVLYKSKQLFGSIAAILMILTLLIDPFLQLIFTFPSRSVEDKTQLAKLQYNNAFTTKWPDEDGGHLGRFWTSVNVGLGIENINEPVTCTSGNCTWQTVKTLGICGSCTNVTTTVGSSCVDWSAAPMGSLKTYSYTFDDGTVLEATILLEQFQTGEPGVITQWNSSLSPSKTKIGHFLAANESVSFAIKNSGNNIVDNCTTTHSYAFDNPTLCSFDFQDANITIYDGGILQWKTLRWLANEYAVNLTLQPTPWDCELYWCEKTFHEPRIVDGGPLQYGLTTERLWSVSPSQRVQSPQPTDNSPFLAAYSDAQFLFLPSQVNDLKGNQLKFDYEGTDMISLQLAKLFMSYTDNIPFIVNYSSSSLDLTEGLSLERFLVESKDLNVTISRLAHSLTELVRTSGNASVNIGQTQVLKSFIKVRWQWLLLPVSLVIGSCVLLTTVVIQTHAKRIPVWKDDPLALLFHQTDGLALIENNKSDTTDLNILAEKLYVKLDRTKPFTFVECERII